MKKFVIRSVGWVFDDSWYNYDGDHDIEGAYSTKEEAKKKREYLNHEYFIEYFYVINRFQRNYAHYLSTNVTFIDTRKIASFLANQLNLEEKDFIDKHNRLGSNQEVTQLITADLVEQILQDNNFTFFKIIEFDSEEILFYHFKKNPFIWRKLYEENFHESEDEYHYFYDNRDDDTIRAVKTIKECYEYAFKDEFDSILHPLLSNNLIAGELSTLSNTPTLLNNIIKTSPNIEYDNFNKCIIFKKDVSAEEIMSLDAVLINPILLKERVSIETLRKLSL